MAKNIKPKGCRQPVPISFADSICWQAMLIQQIHATLYWSHNKLVGTGKQAQSDHCLCLALSMLVNVCILSMLCTDVVLLQFRKYISLEG